MTTIESPRDIPRGLYEGFQFATEQEARAAKTEGYLFQSKIIPAWYVFVPVKEQE